jgi:hypothetical protein
MKKKPDPPADAAELRRRAEERLKRQRPERIVAAGILPAVSGGILPPGGEQRE